MVLEMMRTTSKVSKKSLFLVINFLFLNLLCAAENRWTIAAQKFSYSKGQVSNSVTDATAVSIPADILENINKTLVRNVYPDEKLERARYESRKERQSLYLQLTSEYKKRDSLVLQNYSDSKMKKALGEANKKIDELEQKINANLSSLRAQENQLELEMEKVLNGEEINPFEDTELKRFSRFFKQIFTKEETVILSENILCYKNDNTALYEPAAALLEEDYTSHNFEKAVYSSGINALMTGNITGYGEYISVEVDVYLYPGAKKIASVMEVGSLNELDLITVSLANQIVPALTNSMPVEVSFSLSSDTAAACEIFIDDVLQNGNSKKITIDSGVHSIQFACKGYKTAETSYYFEGNKKYQIDVNLVELQEGILNISLKKPLNGQVIVNGRVADEVDDRHTQIKINGNQILGDFISEDGKTAFFYVPESNYYDGSYVTINPKPLDREKYLDTRRKWMYGAYSAFMVSLIPYFYTYGNLVNQANLYNDGKISRDEAMKWQNSYNVCSGIVIGCGIFWGYELIRYLVAANSVLPEKGKIKSEDK